jgi:spore maturation protein CgeB
VFEAAGAGACLLTDPWEGIELYLTPGQEVLVVRDGADLVEALHELTAERAAKIGAAALRRVLSEHTYDRRAARLNELLVRALADRRAACAA